MSSKPLQTGNNNPLWMVLGIAALLALAGAFGWWVRAGQSNEAAASPGATIMQTAVAAEPLPAEVASIALNPTAVPAPIGARAPQLVKLNLEAQEVVGKLADGTAYTYWTFGGQVPGPLVRVKQGDTVEVHFTNPKTNTMPHSVDFHAATGMGGGGAASQAMPGETKIFRFKAIAPGLFVYHCATPLAAMHIANGQYGLLLVEPPQGLSKVDHEFYVMQGELYTAQPNGTPGKLTLDMQKLLEERPEYFVFNGATDALTTQHPLKAKVGQTVRILFGVGGPNFTSTFHVIGEIFDRVYDQASLSNPLTHTQSAITGPGSASIVEFKLDYPGKYLLVDHALSRAGRGLVGYLEVSGKADPKVFETLTPVTGGGGH
jgi:nitrite reductase (NO-forming)